MHTYGQKKMNTYVVRTHTHTKLNVESGGDVYVCKIYTTHEANNKLQKWNEKRNEIVVATSAAASPPPPRTTFANVELTHSIWFSHSFRLASKQLPLLHPYIHVYLFTTKLFSICIDGETNKKFFDANTHTRRTRKKWSSGRDRGGWGQKYTGERFRMK